MLVNINVGKFSLTLIKIGNLRFENQIIKNVTERLIKKMLSY